MIDFMNKNYDNRSINQSLFFSLAMSYKGHEIACCFHNIAIYKNIKTRMTTSIKAKL